MARGSSTSVVVPSVFAKTSRACATPSGVGELVLDIIQGNTAVVEASRAYDLSPLKVEDWVEDGKRRMENALRANPLDLKERYERQIEELHET